MGTCLNGILFDMKFYFVLPLCTSVKGTLSRNFTPYFYWIIAMCFRFLGDQKTASKNIYFWRSYAHLKFGYFWPLKDVESDLTHSLTRCCLYQWRHWSQMSKNRCISTLWLYVKSDVKNNYFCASKNGWTISKMKKVAEFKKMGPIVRNQGELPVWRHQSGILANLGKILKWSLVLNTGHWKNWWQANVMWN